MTTKAHQLAARVASASWLTSRAAPLTPEQQSLADEWSAAWTKAQEEGRRTGSPVVLVSQSSKPPLNPEGGRRGVLHNPRHDP